MNIVLLNYHGFNSNSAIHVFYLANALCSEGHDCIVLVPDTKEAVYGIGAFQFRYMSFAEALEVGLHFRNHGKPDILHGWTPREVVRIQTEQLVARYGCPYVVHLEDNEERIVSDARGRPFAELASRSLAELDATIPAGLSHPIRYRRFMEGASGASVIMNRLSKFVPPGLPVDEVWPAFAPEFLDLPAASPELRNRLGIAEKDHVLVYPGGVHGSNRHEVMSLCLAVCLLNRDGIPTKLVRLGNGDFGVFLAGLDDILEHVIDIGFLPNHADVVAHLALADVLVQPGKDDDFNAYRLPSKVPEFLATGRPVILPESNIGLHLEDGKNAVLLREGGALELTRILKDLLADKDARQRIGRGGRDFADERFDWKRSAAQLLVLYGKALEYRRSQGRGVEPQPCKEMEQTVLSALAQRYCDMENKVVPVSYATVADFCDSLDHLKGLASQAGDLKDAQRPWMVKAILAQVPPGSRILEIGAGEPLVADMLSQMGYDVWVVDPYDGFGNGPTEFDIFKSRYPRIRFLRQYFTGPDSQIPAGGFDAVYSISVLEHVPKSLLIGLFEGIRACLRPLGRTIHAIDHVLRGAGAESHLDSLQVMASQCGISAPMLQEQLDAASVDTETYFLSAEGHNRWRGTVPYKDFPMRVCVSVQICVPAASMKA
ncbi:MAG TPA: methyltransferase domain-containing protein [Ancylobacter sp.]